MLSLHSDLEITFSLQYGKLKVILATNFFFEKFVKPSGPFSYVLNVRSLSKILKDLLKFKRWNIEEGKALNHWIRMEEPMIRLLKSLEGPGVICKKEKNDLHLSGSKPGVLHRLAKKHKALEDGILSSGPILSAIAITTYKQARFCDQLL